MAKNDSLTKEKKGRSISIVAMLSNRLEGGRFLEDDANEEELMPRTRAVGRRGQA